MENGDLTQIFIPMVEKQTDSCYTSSDRESKFVRNLPLSIYGCLKMLTPIHIIMVPHPYDRITCWRQYIAIYTSIEFSQLSKKRKKTSIEYSMSVYSDM